jgi:flagellar hook assembly protein FlgD
MYIVEKLDEAQEYTVKEGDTLEDIAKKAEFKASYPDLDWRILARFNWATDNAREVLRALSETVGVKVADLSTVGAVTNPEKLKLVPDADLNPTLRIPKLWKKENLDLEKTHTVTVKRHTPANAVSITELDKWFIPEEETCAIEYQLEGDEDFADSLEIDIYGSNYCDCTAWNKGFGTYGAVLEDEPIYKLDLKDEATERNGDALPGEGWNGKVTTTKGMLGRKPADETDRFINVAFSPYTVQFRYWKADGDKKARLKLEPFWPQWDEVPTTPATTKEIGADNIKVKWTNADDADRGEMVIKDKNGQVVYYLDLTGDLLKKGARDATWDKKYRKAALNSKFLGKYLDDSGEAIPKNAPYTFVVKTFKLKEKTTPADKNSLKIQWEIKDASDLERGLLQVTDKEGKIVFQKPLVKGKLQNGKQNYVWDGKYSKGIKNSRGVEGEDKEGDDKIIPEDMPYRVQVQAHRGIDKAEGLALAAMHTEVRIFADAKTHLDTAEDYYSDTHTVSDPQSIDLSLAPLYLGDNAPADKTKSEWVQYKLAMAGFQPGPVDGKVRDEVKMALKEFQRSVPKRKTGAKFERLTINGTADDDTKTAIEHMNALHVRPWFGKSADRSDYPQSSDAEIKAISDDLKDDKKKMVVWIDWRHYFTQAGSGSIQALVKLDQYRGGMEKGDQVVTDDKDIVSRPWIPLRAELRLVSKDKSLKDEVVAETDEEKQKKIRRAIGPLRVDWSFVELPPDYEPIVLGSQKKERVRTKLFVQWALNESKATHEHKNPKRTVTLTNAPALRGGLRPDGGAAAYYKALFGTGDDDSLRPWNAVADDTTESVATIVHDFIFKDQPTEAAPLDKKNRGFAGVFFRPSTIAGDGYQVRSQVRFEKLAGQYEFPNLDVLKGRYPKIPQSNTAELRNWRKSTFRGLIQWGANVDHFDEAKQFLSSGHVHYVYEMGTVATYTPSEILTTPADIDAVKQVIADYSAQTWNKNKGEMDINNNYCFPWWDLDNLGWKKASSPNLAEGDLIDNLIDPCMEDTFGKYCPALLPKMMQFFEEKDGRLRGHIMATFRSTRDVYVQRYKCQSCNKFFWYLEKNSTGKTAIGRACPGCSKNGVAGLQEDGQCKSNYKCSTCNVAYNNQPDRFPNGGKFVGKNCPTGGHVGTLVMEGAATQTVAPTAPKKKRNELVNFGEAEVSGGIWMLGALTGWEWAHEVGHQRHLEHSASAPVGSRTGQRRELHDSEKNELEEWKRSSELCDQGCGTEVSRAHGSKVDNCPSCNSKAPMTSTGRKDKCTDVTCGAEIDLGVSDAAGPCGTCGQPTTPQSRTDKCDRGCRKRKWRKSSDPVTANCPNCSCSRLTTQPERPHSDDELWDRCCTMSYVDLCDTHEPAVDGTYFCGKCVLRLRGWKVQAIAGGPGPRETTPP